MKNLFLFLFLIIIPFNFLSAKKAIKIKMVFIPGGRFKMGNWRGNDNERPLHKVYLKGYYISKYEITQGQYQKFIEATGHRKPNCKWDPINKARYPVVCVSYYDASAFCRWARGRLPTEAEWEKAARGTDGRTWPWGNQRASCKYAVMDNYKGEGCGRKWAWPVGSKPRGASPYGVHDMAGNVWEWVADWYDEKYYKKSPYRNPQGPRYGKVKVIRGGGFFSASRGLRCTVGRDMRCSHRVPYEPGARDYVTGFRLARDRHLKRLFYKRIKQSKKSFVKGARVFGLWSGYTWYPGRIAFKCRKGYMVHFNDGDKKCLALSEITKDQIPVSFKLK